MASGFMYETRRIGSWNSSDSENKVRQKQVTVGREQRTQASKHILMDKRRVRYAGGDGGTGWSTVAECDIVCDS